MQTSLRSTAVLVAIGGAPGTGKTTVGRALARELGAALLDLDTVTNPLMDTIDTVLGTQGNLDAPQLRAFRGPRYRCLADTARDVVDAGCTAVVVAPFTAELADHVAWQAFSHSQTTSTPESSVGPAEFAGQSAALLVELRLDPAVAQSRRQARGLARDLAGSGQVAALPPPSEVADLVLDARAPTRELVAAIRQALDAGRSNRE